METIVSAISGILLGFFMVILALVSKKFKKKEAELPSIKKIWWFLNKPKEFKELEARIEELKEIEAEDSETEEEKQEALRSLKQRRIKLLKKPEYAEVMEELDLIEQEDLE